MTLRDSLEAQGQWLFRHRSFLPLLILPIFVLAVRSVEVAESHMPRSAELWYEGVGLIVALAGFAVRAYTVGTVPRGTSGRNTARQEAASLNTQGIYSVVRHPLYVGNYLVTLGCTVFTGSWWLPVILSVLFWIYYERIMFAEEEYLRGLYGECFAEWAARTPAFIPRLRHWRAPELPFSWRTVLRREYPTLLTITAIMGLSEVLGDLLFDPAPHLNTGWAAVVLAGIITALTLRQIKRKTALLDMAGRP